MQRDTLTAMDNTFIISQRYVDFIHAVRDAAISLYIYFPLTRLFLQWAFALNCMCKARNNMRYNELAVQLLKAVHPRFVIMTEVGRPRMCVSTHSLSLSFALCYLSLYLQSMKAFLFAIIVCTI